MVGGFGHDGVDEILGDDEARPLGRFRDHGSQLLLAQRADDNLSSGELRSELGDPGAVAIEIRPSEITTRPAASFTRANSSRTNSRWVASSSVSVNSSSNWSTMTTSADAGTW